MKELRGEGGIHESNEPWVTYKRTGKQAETDKS
jgi:hypothetical protein